MRNYLGICISACILATFAASCSDDKKDEFVNMCETVVCPVGTACNPLNGDCVRAADKCFNKV